MSKEETVREAKKHPPSKRARLSLYLRDPGLKPQVRAAAAKRNVSVSEYCQRAIEAWLVEDGERPAASIRGWYTYR